MCNSLPLEILLEIIRKLDVNDINSICLTCKSFYSKFNPLFIEKARNKFMMSNLEFEHVKLVTKRLQCFPDIKERLVELYSPTCMESVNPLKPSIKCMLNTLPKSYYCSCHQTDQVYKPRTFCVVYLCTTDTSWCITPIVYKTYGTWLFDYKTFAGVLWEYGNCWFLCSP